MSKTEKPCFYPGLKVKDLATKEVWTLVKRATFEDAEKVLGKAPEIRKYSWERYSSKWIGKNEQGKEVLLVQGDNCEMEHCQRTSQEWREILAAVELERHQERKQAGENYDVAVRYEEALKKIARLLGYKGILTKDSYTPPIEDIGQIALDLVQVRLHDGWHGEVEGPKEGWYKKEKK